MSLAKRDEGRKVNSDINVTPMVDVMLVLLIIFMVVTPMLVPGVPVALAQTQNPVNMADADKEGAILVALTHDGGIFLGSERVAADSLGSRIKTALERKTDKKVFVKSDARVKYGSLADVVDNLRSAGADQIGLLTEQRRLKATPGAPLTGRTTIPGSTTIQGT